MGMNVTGSAVKKDQLWIDYSEPKYNWWADYKLLELLERTGTILSDQEKKAVLLPISDDYDHIHLVADIILIEEQLNELITICDQIINVTYKAGESRTELEKKYTNETEAEFIKRWKHIQNNLISFRNKLDWESEHVVIYTSY